MLPQDVDLPGLPAGSGRGEDRRERVAAGEGGHLGSVELAAVDSDIIDLSLVGRSWLASADLQARLAAG